jgi:type IV pilus assembly protein PilQ
METKITSKQLRTVSFIILLSFGIFGSLSCNSHISKVKAGVLEQNSILTQSDKTKPRLGAPNKIISLNTNSSFAVNGQDETVTVSVKSSEEIFYTALKGEDPLRLVLDFPDMSKGNIPNSLIVEKGVVDTIRTQYSREGNSLRMEIFLNQNTSYDIKKGSAEILTIALNKSGTEIVNIDKTDMSNESKLSEKISVETVSAEPVDPCSILLGGKKDKIHLDFQNASLPNILRTFSEVSGLNIIISDEIKGDVNIRLRDVPWNQAFQIILANNQLKVECIGLNVLNVTLGNSFASQNSNLGRLTNDQNKTLTDPTSKNEKLVTKVKQVNYGDISKISESINSLKSEKGNIIIDERINTFILSDLPANVNKMLEFIDILDKKSPQVLIEARIVTVSKSYSKELGIEWGLTGAIAKNRNSIREDFNSQQGEVVITNSSGNIGVGNPLVNLGTTSTATSGLGILAGNILSGLDLDLRLSAMESDGRGRVLSAPKVTTMDHQVAEISSGRRIPYETTSNEGTATQFIDAELSLKVTPHVTSNEDIILDIHATKNAADFTNTDGNNNPTITTNEAKSQVMIASGHTTVLGGIYEKTRTETEKKVPFLSAIPILGFLFQNMDDEDIISEILIFITPTIVIENKNKLVSR